MIDLEHELRDLGAHLDHPAGDRIVPELRFRLQNPAVAPKTSRRVVRRRRPLAVAVTAVAAALLLAGSLPASREAFAEIFGIDSSSSPPADRVVVPHDHGSTAPTAPPGPEIELLDLASARTAVDFPIRVPTGEPAPQVTVDHRVPGGLVSLTYPEFRLVEVPSPPDVTGELAEMVPPTSRVRVVSVRNRPGLWITGTHHEIAYLDRDGALRHEPSRATGHVLLWEEGGVTYRVEGFEHQSSASDIAHAIE